MCGACDAACVGVRAEGVSAGALPVPRPRRHPPRRHRSPPPCARSPPPAVSRAQHAGVLSEPGGGAPATCVPFPSDMSGRGAQRVAGLTSGCGGGLSNLHQLRLPPPWPAATRWERAPG
eukprot:2552675-Rhodomonas_salina.1